MTGDRRRQSILCGLAIALFIACFLLRYLDWSSLDVGTVDVHLTGNRGFLLKPSHTVGYPGTEWEMLGPISGLYAVLLIVPNLIYVFRAKTDLLVPAIANSGIGAMLTALTVYFIVSPTNAMCCITKTTGITYNWNLEPAAFPALACAVAILGIGIAEGMIRQRVDSLKDATPA